MTNKLDKQEIESLLPHREPMLLIDELYDIKKLTSATGIVNVKKDNVLIGKKELDATKIVLDLFDKNIKSIEPN